MRGNPHGDPRRRCRHRATLRGGANPMFIRKAAPVFVLVVLALVHIGPAMAAGKPPASKAPSNLRVTAIGQTSVSVAWDAGSGSGTWWYCVQNGGAGCYRVDPPKTTFTHPSLTPGATYT